jgi:hypothetical protein
MNKCDDFCDAIDIYSNYGEGLYVIKGECVCCDKYDTYTQLQILYYNHCVYYTKSSVDWVYLLCYDLDIYNKIYNSKYVTYMHHSAYGTIVKYNIIKKDDIYVEPTDVYCLLCHSWHCKCYKHKYYTLKYADYEDELNYDLVNIIINKT